MADTGAPWNLPYPLPTDLVRDGAQAIQDLAEATAAGLSDAIPPDAFVFVGTRYFESTDTFEKADPLETGDIGLKAIRVRLVGGGGGAGGCRNRSNCASGGGGGGAYAESFITDIEGLDSSVIVTVGAGGDGGPGQVSGSAGGTSSFGALVAADGGGRGIHTTAVGQLQVSDGGGQSGTGDLVIAGSNPTAPYFSSGGNSVPITASGGPSHLSGSTGPTGDETNGTNGSLYGGGGGGAATTTGSVDLDGGDGADGIVIIDCFV